ncbi:MAG: hypothetical protein ACXACC_07840 [Promethearchaeota archaeon]
MGSLIEFLKRKTTLNVLEKSIKHAQIVQQCVKELEIGITTMCQGIRNWNKHFT